jgi:hypothetical protein
MTVSNDVRAKEYNGAQAASGALKIEKVETHTNIKVHGPVAAVGAEKPVQGGAQNPAPQNVGVKPDANVVDLKLGTKALKDFGVELTSDPTPVTASQPKAHDAPLKALQAEANGPSYKSLIVAAAALVVVIAGLSVWAGLSGSQDVVSVPASVDPVAVQPVVADQTSGASAAVATVGENDFVAQMTAGTIAALRAGATARAEPVVIVSGEVAGDAAGEVKIANDAKLAAATLFSMVLDATAKDLSRPEIDHMLNIAYTDGTIKVPEPFLLGSGRVNTGAIMAAFVGQ